MVAKMAVGHSTTMSTKGQVILPKSVRDALHWEPGMKLVVERDGNGVRLRLAQKANATRLEDVAGCLKYSGPPVSIEDMDKGVAEYFKQRYARD